MKTIFHKEKNEFGLLLRSIPATVVTLFVVSVISMNLLANKTLLQVNWIALDGGILISWLSFMCMDIITKHFGPKASNSITVLAAVINLLTCLIFFVASAIPSNAGDFSAFDGTQNEDDIDINLKALIHITEKYGVQPNIKSVLNIGSASGHTGAEFPEYCASKGGVLAYTKNVAMRVAKFGATCNSLDPGGVLTPLNECVMNDPELWAEIMEETPLKRWATTEEIDERAYFLTVTNTFCTGQNILVDGGEAINYNFVWKD